MHIELAIQRSDSNPQSQKPGTAPLPRAWKPSKMFPVLVLLLLACYGIMAMVLVEQGGVIQSQGNVRNGPGDRRFVRTRRIDHRDRRSLRGQAGATAPY